MGSTIDHHLPLHELNPQGAQSMGALKVGAAMLDTAATPPVISGLLEWVYGHGCEQGRGCRCDHGTGINWQHTQAGAATALPSVPPMTAQTVRNLVSCAILL